jgi:MFS transporter, UMF1 family
MGPLLVGATAQLTGNSSMGVFSLVILFIVGLVILARVPEPKVDVALPKNQSV